MSDEKLDHELAWIQDQMAEARQTTPGMVKYLAKVEHDILVEYEERQVEIELAAEYERINRAAGAV